MMIRSRLDRLRRSDALACAALVALALALACTRGHDARSTSRAGARAAADATAVSLFDHATEAPALDVADSPVELGLRLRTDADGTIGAIAFYRAPGTTVATHRVSLWSATGALLAQATSTAETGSGWQRVVLDPPVAVRAGDVLVASYFAADGHYGATHAGIPAAGIDRPPLHALPGLDAGGASANGVYTYGGGFPTASYSSSSYGVDVELTPSGTTTPTTPPATAATLWDHAQAGNAPAAEATDASAVELGVRFRADVDGTLQAIDFYRTPGTTAATHRVSLWSGAGALLAQATSTAETSSGWQRVALDPPVTIQAGATYVASYLAPDGRYGATPAGIPAAGLDRAPLHALPGADAGGGSANGVYTYGAGGGFPVSSYHSTNYWVDVELAAAAPPAVAGAGLWDDATAGGAEASDATPVELGVRWRADVAGQVTALRFWKTAGNAGPHVGRLWDAGGRLLAAVTFTGETASGWQTQPLPFPVDVVPGDTYVASYSAPAGHYAFTDLGLAAGLDRAPLHALPGSAAGGNGVFGAPGQFPARTFAGHGPNYWVDLRFVPRTSSLWPDTAAGGAEDASSAPVEAGVRWRADVAGQVTALRFWKTPGNAGPHVGHLWDEWGQLLATVTFAGESAGGWQTQALDAPVAVAAGATYVASYTAPAGHAALTAGGLAEGAGAGPLHALPGATAGNGVSGPPGVFPGSDDAGSPNHWVDVAFSPSAPPPADPRRAPGAVAAPIALLLPRAAGTYSGYYPEILRAEGLGGFRTVALATAGDLSGYAAAILPEGGLTAAELDLVTRYVNAGGVLVAMRPDDGLAPLLGLGAREGAVADGFFQVAAGRWGITELPLQFHGAADARAPLPGTAVEATLRDRAGAATPYPAVTVRTGVGSGSGTAVAFLFDVARSVVLTRQGNPALVGDRLLDPVGRSSELFYAAGGGATHLDLSRFGIPQADELQRLLAGVLQRTGGAALPLPRFWYLPGGRKAAVLLSGDDHNVGGTAAVFDALLQPPTSPAGCAVGAWTCARATSWVYTQAGLDAARIGAYRAQGFEIGPHLALQLDDMSCTQWTSLDDLRARLTANQAAFVAAYGVAPAATNRTHCFVFDDWDSEPIVERELGIRLDENYTPYSPHWILDRVGLLNGSATPMRFTAADGSVIDVYQVVSNIDYEYFARDNWTYAAFRAAVEELLAGADAGYVGIFGTHYDYSGGSGLELQAILDAAVARNAAAADPAEQVALVSAQQVLSWLDLRDGAAFAVHGIDASGVLTFGITLPSGVENAGLEATLPLSAGGRVLVDLRRADGSAVAVKRTRVVNGVPSAFFDAVAEDGYRATYR